VDVRQLCCFEARSLALAFAQKRIKNDENEITIPNMENVTMTAPSWQYDEMIQIGKDFGSREIDMTVIFRVPRRTWQVNRIVVCW
jgi:hypothetical protein